jgi:hypothetical protein
MTTRRYIARIAAKYAPVGCYGAGLQGYRNGSGHKGLAEGWATFRDYRNVWSAAELQAKNEKWQLVCANVFGLQWSHRLRAMMDIRSPSSV